MRCAAAILCFLPLSGCGTGVQAPWFNGSTDHSQDASVRIDAGSVPSPADVGGPPTPCQDNEDCWFGEGCYEERCIDQLLLEGSYERTPITNDWHRVTVEMVDGELEWSNAADVFWHMEFRGGTLWTMTDCPYGVQELTLDWDEHLVSGIRFQSELYRRVD